MHGAIRTHAQQRIGMVPLRLAFLLQCVYPVVAGVLRIRT
jgi:hypothetical protein